MIRGKSIVCFGGEDWWYHHPHSKTHLMRRFARAGNRVLFVNSLSMGLPSAKSPDFFLKIGRKLGSYLRFARTTPEGIVVLSPVAVPAFDRPWAQAANRLLLGAQLRSILRLRGFGPRPIVWAAIPTAYDAAVALGPSLLVYQVSDKYDANVHDHATDMSFIADLHRRFLARADRVLYSGRKLFDEATEARGKSRLLAQAVDFEHFARASTGELAPPEDLERIPHPRLGYFGAADFVIDQALVRRLSAERPDWHWVFVGLKSRVLSIESLPNVHFLGPRPYADVPRYAAGFDACVLPWTTGDPFVDYGSAIKVREYLATGRPVVITPLYEYARFEGPLRIARSVEEFRAHVEWALTPAARGEAPARQALVRDQTWERRAEEVSADLESLASARERDVAEPVPAA